MVSLHKITVIFEDESWWGRPVESNPANPTKHVYADSMEDALAYVIKSNPSAVRYVPRYEGHDYSKDGMRSGFERGMQAGA